MPEIVGRLRPPRLSAAPASPANGEIYFDTGGSLPAWYNGSAWVAFNAIPALASTPPASPSDGQLWAMSPTAGVVWVFRYNAGSASAYKWEFVGGPPQTASVGTSETTTSTSYVDLTTVGPSIALARGGDYLFSFGCICLTSGWACASPTAVDADGVIFDLPGTTVGSHSSRSYQRNGLAASTTQKLVYRCSGASTTFQQRWLTILPIRVS